VFDMFAMTAAHRTLPLGTLVEVKHKISGKSVIVRINDRGPYVKNRIIDLSYAAADRLGMTGISQVSLSVVGNRDGRPLSGAHAFFVRLRAEERVSDTIERQLRRLIRIGLHNAASLLHVQEGVMALGPYERFQDSQDALIRIATTHPEASIILAEKDSMIPAILAVAVR
jgi:rare lipoprotein A